MLGLNMLYKLPAKKVVLRSLNDALLLIVFSLELERLLKNDRKILVEGSYEDKLKMITFFANREDKKDRKGPSK